MVVHMISTKGVLTKKYRVPIFLQHKILTKPPCNGHLYLTDNFKLMFQLLCFSVYLIPNSRQCLTVDMHLGKQEKASLGKCPKDKSLCLFIEFLNCLNFPITFI